MWSSPFATAVRARDQAAPTPGLPSTEVRRRFLLPWRKWFVGVGVLAYPSQVACIQQGCYARIWQWKRDVHFPAGHSNVFQQCGLAIGNGTCYWKYLRRNAMVVSVLHALECLSIIMLLLTFKRSCIVLSQTKDAKLLSPSWHPTESTSKTPNDEKEHDKTGKKPTKNRCEIIAFNFEKVRYILPCWVTPIVRNELWHVAHVLT